MGNAFRVSDSHIIFRGDQGIAPVGNGNNRYFIFKELNRHIDGQNTRQNVIAIFILLENRDGIDGNGFGNELTDKSFLPTAGPAFLGAGISFLVLVIGSRNQADFVFSKAGKTHEFALGGFRAHARFIGQHHSHNLGNQVTGVGKGMQQEGIQISLGHFSLAQGFCNVITHKFP